MSDIKILQIGEGNFIRAFFDYYIQIANEKYGYDGSVAMCQPRTNTKVIDALKKQDNKFDVITRGIFDGALIDERKTVTCVSKCLDTVSEWEELKKIACLDSLDIIVSNTTEAGIEYVPEDKYEDAPAVSYPAKLTCLLYERYKSGKDGVVVLPLELIENNADALRIDVLKYAVKWDLDDPFIDYIYNECSFCNTLVDRIVTGHTEGDPDPCSVNCEPFFTLIIEADDKCKEVFPVVEEHKIIFAEDTKPFRDSKVKILNGLHTFAVLGAYIHGYDIVREMVTDPEFKELLDGCLDEEILPTVRVDVLNKNKFAEFVLERFSNPFIDHKLLDISLNSVSKFKTRCMPTLIDYYNTYHKAPRYMSLSLAYLIRFYKGEFKDGKYIGTRVKHGVYNEYEIRDSRQVLEAFDRAYKTDDPVKAAMSDVSLWEIDLTKLDGLYDAVKKEYDEINR